MKRAIYRLSLVVLTLIITAAFGLGTAGTGLAKKPAAKKGGPHKKHAEMIQGNTLAQSNDYVVLAAAKKAAPKKPAPKKKK